MLYITSVFGDQNIIIRSISDEGDQFLQVNPVVFEDAADGVEVGVDAGSTGFDTLEDKRNNAIAMGNISLQYHNAGVPVALDKNYLEILKWFPGVKNPQDHLNEQQPQMPGMEAGGMPGGAPQGPPIDAIPPVNQNV